DEDAAYARALSVIDGATALTKLSLSDLPANVKAIYRDEASRSYVLYVATRTQWVATESEGMVVVKDGTIQKVDMITWTVGHGVNYTPEYLASFIGKDKTSIDGVDLVTGATGTAQNFANAVKEAMEKLPNENGGIPTLTEDQAYDRALALVTGATALTKQSGENLPATVKAVYFDEASGTYVLYLATRTQWVATETEGMVAVKDGTILAVDMITWTVGHGVNYTPEYLNSFKDKNKTGLGGVELVTGATGTSQNFVNAVKEALVYTLGGVPTLDEQEAYDRALGLIEGATALEQPFIEDLPDNTKAVYFDKESGVYVLYVATRTQWVATESEGMVVVKDGTIQKVDMITWTVGHGVNYTTEYLNSFKDKNKTNIDSVELVAEATGTSQNFLNAVKGAMEAVVTETDTPFFPAAPAPIYRYIGIGIAAVAILWTAAVIIIRKRRGF
ncbi:MAG: FMN-binding protein, partial [Clostridia bacterium]|nr:FMN-binding protein [Clostridia bacterium]